MVQLFGNRTKMHVLAVHSGRRAIELVYVFGMYASTQINIPRGPEVFNLGADRAVNLSMRIPRVARLGAHLRGRYQDRGMFLFLGEASDPTTSSLTFLPPLTS